MIARSCHLKSYGMTAHLRARSTTMYLTIICLTPLLKWKKWPRQTMVKTPILCYWTEWKCLRNRYSPITQEWHSRKNSSTSLMTSFVASISMSSIESVSFMIVMLSLNIGIKLIRHVSRYLSLCINMPSLLFITPFHLIMASDQRKTLSKMFSFWIWKDPKKTSTKYLL